MTIVALSDWLAACARASGLFQDRRIEVIGNPIDAKQYKPLDKLVSRRAFNLPLEKQLILFGAVGGTRDKRKGFRYLREALDGISAENIELVIFGAAEQEELALDVPTHQVGRLQDEVSLSVLYSACDLFTLPSLQDNLPNTIIETLACGTPCVAFDGTGTNALLQHKKNGYLARLQDSSDLREGIEWILAQTWPRNELHERIIARYGSRKVATQVIQLYYSVLGDTP